MSIKKIRFFKLVGKWNEEKYSIPYSFQELGAMVFMKRNKEWVHRYKYDSIQFDYSCELNNSVFLMYFFLCRFVLKPTIHSHYSIPYLFQIDFEFMKNEILEKHISNDKESNRQKTFYKIFFKKFDLKKCYSLTFTNLVSLYIIENNFKKNDLFSKKIYYVSSLKREEELLKFYKKDHQIICFNIPSLFNGIILKQMFPHKRLIIQDFKYLKSNLEHEKTFYNYLKDFYEREIKNG